MKSIKLGFFGLVLAVALSSCEEEPHILISLSLSKALLIPITWFLHKHRNSAWYCWKTLPVYVV